MYMQEYTHVYMACFTLRSVHAVQRIRARKSPVDGWGLVEHFVPLENYMQLNII